MINSKIFRTGREKSLAPYLLQSFKSSLSQKRIANLSWIVVDTKEEGAMPHIQSLTNSTSGICFSLSNNKDCVLWLEKNIQYVENILQKSPAVRFCVNVFQLVDLKVFLQKLKLGSPHPEVQIEIDAIDFGLDSVNRLPANSSQAISDAITLSAGFDDAFFTFKTTTENCFWADDVNQLFDDPNRILFYPSIFFVIDQPTHQLSTTERETAFHNLMFYDNLARHKSLNLATRFFYKRLKTILEKKGSSKLFLRTYAQRLGLSKVVNEFPLTSELMLTDFEKLFAPELPEVFQLTSNLVKGKLSTFFKKSQAANIKNEVATEPETADPHNWKRVIITGWYGTETQGDKAIIGEVLHFIKACSPNCKIVLTTIYSKISVQTNFELKDLEGVELISIYELNFSHQVAQADAVIMGGGPIMETNEMVNVLRLFAEANRQKKARIIFGCGIGPFHSQYIIEVTTRVLELTTAGFVRDLESLDYARKLFPKTVLKFACDPAVAFISRWKREYQKRTSGLPAKEKKIACLLRANTNEFAADRSPAAMEQINLHSATQIGNFLEPVCKDLGYSADLLHMNAPWLGGDDRLFNRFVESQFSEQELVRNERRYLSLDEHIERMLTSEVALAMRYHGHVFCLALGIPFVSIDYTGKKGKVGSLVRRIGYAEWSQEWGEIESDKVASKIRRLVEQKDAITIQLETETSKLVALLYHTYFEVFGVKLKF